MNPLEILQTLTPTELAIGSGVTFPIEITETTRKVWDDSSKTYTSKKVKGWYPKLGDINLIKHNLESLIVYNRGFRIRQEDYGNVLESLLEEPNSQALRFYIKQEIISLFNTFEPRISFKHFQMNYVQAGLIIRITFSLNSEVPIEDYFELLIPSNS